MRSRRGSWSRGLPTEDCLQAMRNKAPRKEELAWGRERSRTWAQVMPRYDSLSGPFQPYELPL